MAEFSLICVAGIDGSEPTERTIHTFALAVDGASVHDHVWHVPKVIAGPADLYMNVDYVTDNDMVISGGFWSGLRLDQRKRIYHGQQEQETTTDA